MANIRFNARHGLSVGSTPIDVIDNNGQVATSALSIVTNTTPAVFIKDDNLTAWDYSGKSFVVSGQESSPAGIFFKPDGLVMYVIGSSGDDVNQYSLSVAWDVSTASFVRASANIGETSPAGVFFKPDGLVMYVTGFTNDTVREFSLSTAWDVSTIAFVRDFSVAAQDTTPQDLWFKPDGTKMYMVGSTNGRVYEYNLSTAWNVSSASFLQFFSVSAQDSVPVAINFNADGTKMYLLGQTGQDINRYSLSTPWDISTAVFFNNFYVGFQATSPSGMFINFDGDRAYVVGSSTDAVHQYNTVTDGIELVSSSGLFVEGSLYTNKNLFVTAGTRIDGTMSVSGATTLGSSLIVGSTTTLGSSVTMSTTTGTISIGTSQTSGTTTIGGLAQTGGLTLGRSTSAQTVDIAVGATTSGTTKTVNIGTSGVSGSITNINIGSSVSGSLGTTTLNSALTTPLQITSTLATGTAPFVVTSTTRVANLNVATAGNADTATNVAYSGLTGTVPTWNQNTTGSAATLTTGRTIALTGDVTYTSGAFNGSANVTGTATLASVGTAGTYTKVTTDAKGRVTSGTTLVAADIPALDASKITSGTIDAARLPSYVDDVLEFTNLAGFPATGETGKIYVALDTNKTYRWSGSAYVQITSGAVDSVAGKTGVVTLVKGDVGLGSVDNTADSAKNVSSAATLTTARTLTIGSTGKTFNGSANVAWSLAEIGAQVAGNYVTIDTTQTITKPKIIETDQAVGLTIRNTVNGAGAVINFSDHPAESYLQNGSIKYFHGDGVSYGSGAAFFFDGNQTSHSYVFGPGAKILPDVTNTGEIGNSTYTWANGRFTNLTVTGTITGSISGNAATATNVAYSGLTGTVPTWNQNTTGNAGTVTNGVYTTGDQTIGGQKTFTAQTAFTNASNQLLLKFGSTSNPTLIHRVDDINYYLLLSAAGTALSGTWNTLRPFLINLTSGRITSDNGQIFNGGTIINEVGAAADTRIEGDTDVNLVFVDASTDRVGIGTNTPGYKLEVNGSFAATSKSFLIAHPTKEGKKLRHGSLEGPEHGVYVRGKVKGTVIELPEYWTKLVDPDSITVQLTAVGKGQKLYVEDIRDNKVYIANDGVFAGEPHCFYLVQAERIDIDKMDVEID